MSKRRRNPSNSGSAARASDGNANQRLRPLWLGCVTALFVATPLIPSEAAPTGLGVSLLMGWFVLCSAFFITGAIQRNLRLRIGATEIAVLVFVALHTLSALLLADAGQPRQTLNMLWQWVGMGVAFLLLRQVVRTPQESRALVVVMIALAVVLSMHGYFQYFYSLPETRRAYEADREGMLAEVGIVAPVDREQFENRLYSTEPMATFSLANSLAGFLTPWLLCAVGIGVLNWSNRAMRLRVAMSAGVSTLVVAGCFILTKSRSATMAVLLGAGLLVAYGIRSGWRPGWKLVVAVLCLVVVLVTLAVSVGGLDLLVVTESLKSFLYRVQYWRASVAMIADAPWFGCGPGNFQQSYTAYKLPEASEEISDPHNFLLEIWSTAGTPAMLAFIGVFVCFAVQLRNGTSAFESRVEPSDGEDIGYVRAVYLGALAGLPFGFSAGLAVAYPVPNFLFLLFVGLPVAAAVLIGWHPWVLHGRLPVGVLVVAASALLVNLSAAGGISFAGVTLTLWLLLATALNLSDESRLVHTLSGRNAAALAASAVLIASLFWYSTFAPVLHVLTKLAQTGELQSVGRLREAEEMLLDATAADSYSKDPWQALAHLRLAMWLDGSDESLEAAFAEAARATLDHNRRSSAAHQAYGDWYLRAFRATNEKRFLEEAIAGYRRAVELYPNYNLGHAQLAWALQIAGRFAESSVEAGEALRLDRLNPHREQKLVELAVFDLPDRVDSQWLRPPNINAEQLMQLLRSRPDG